MIDPKLNTYYLFKIFRRVNFTATVTWIISFTVLTRVYLAVSSSSRPWIDVFSLPEKFNMAVTESDLDPKVRKMFITF